MLMHLIIEVYPNNIIYLILFATLCIAETILQHFYMLRERFSCRNRSQLHWERLHSTETMLSLTKRKQIINVYEKDTTD